MEAEKPRQLPRAAWWQITKRTWGDISAANLPIISAGVAFYALLAVFPALAAFISIYGLVTSPQDVERAFSSMSDMLPQEAASMVQSQLHRLVQTSSSALGIGAIFGFLASLWSAMSGIKGMMTALNVAYEEQEKRSFLRLNGAALALTLGGIAAAIIALVLIAAVPPVINNIAMPGWLAAIINWVRWPLLAILFVVGLSGLYRYGPSRNAAEWHWASYGAIVAAVLWLIVSAVFSVYVNNFGSYDKTYGTLGAVIVLMLWLELSALVILIGAVFNSETERQTATDTTAGPPQHMGQRGARVADTVVGTDEKCSQQNDKSIR